MISRHLSSLTRESCCLATDRAPQPPVPHQLPRPPSLLLALMADPPQHVTLCAPAAPPPSHLPQGQEEPDGEDYLVEAADEGPRPFYCLLDAGLKRTSTGSKTFGALKVRRLGLGGRGDEAEQECCCGLRGVFLWVGPPLGTVPGMAWLTVVLRPLCPALSCLTVPPIAPGCPGWRAQHPPQREALCGLDQGGGPGG